MGLTDKEKIHLGQVYYPSGDEIMSEQLRRIEKVNQYNKTRPVQQKKRAKMLKKMFAEIGDGCYIEPPLHANFGCKNVHFGKNVYANFNLTLVDDTHIYVGDYTMIAPNVTLATGTHPVLPELRQKAYQYNLPITIGKNVWLGAHVVVLPGVTIGDNTVIGAGSVVTKDIPANVVAYGNPCKVVREISEHDKIYYYKDRKIADCGIEVE